MAITNAQQYKQLLAKGGRTGFFIGGNFSTSSTRDAQRGSTNRERGADRNRSQSKAPSKSSSNTSSIGGGGGGKDMGADSPPSYLPPGYDINKEKFVKLDGSDETAYVPPTKKEIDKIFEEKEKKKKNNFLTNLLTSRRKQAYNFARNLPGAKKSSLANLNAYRDYLVSQGADLSTIDRLMEGVDEENAIGFDPFQELAYDYEPKGIEDIETLRSMFTDTTRGPFDKITAVPQNYSDFMLTQRNNPTLFAAGDLGNFMNKPKPKDLVNPNTGELYTNAEWNALKQDIGQDRGLMGGSRDDAPDDPCKGPNPPAYCNVGNDDDDDDTTTPDRNLGGLAPRFAGSIFDFTGLADGGRAGYMDGGMMEDTPEGGIMDLESGRQMYFLGKLVKKATRAVKKVAKSPFGKAALGAALFKFGGGFGGGGTGILSGLKGKLFGMPKEMIAGPIQGLLGTGSSGTMGLLGKLGLTKGGGSMMPTLKGGLTLGFGLPFALDALGVGKKDDEGFDIDEYYRTGGINIADIRNNPYNYLSARNQGSIYNFADGGRTGYQEGGDAEPVAKKTMPLLDMDGMEKDYREEGGFVPIGRMERADDVPARLSKNEFVFTADAVRNAGEGDIDKGAEVMYNMMKNLESGGEVSEESQGLDGAREMFKTSQRLEEVL